MRFGLVTIALLMQFFLGAPASAVDWKNSGRSALSGNPYLAYGYNPRSGLTTGYLAAFRIGPGRTDECKLVFRRDVNGIAVKYLEETWVPGPEGRFDRRAAIVMQDDEPVLKFPKTSLGGDCDWILPFNVGPHVFDTSDEVAVKMNVPDKGNWIGVYVISAKRAWFHAQPNDISVQKSYLIGGDVIFVYDERPDWYFVQYDNGKKKTVGWIKKADTVQP